jgi:hypothetical protein
VYFFSSKTQSTKWQSILAANPTSINLWTKYLDANQTNFVAFRYEEGKESFLACIKMLKNALDQSKESDPALWHVLTYILLRVTLFMREAGFIEHAVSVWQGLLELNFFNPSFDDGYMDGLQEFWDSEVARIGEDGAEGWCNYVKKGEFEPIPDATTDPSVDQIHRSHLFEHWMKAESMRTRTSLQPARTGDDVAEDDPYRVALFADISPLMFSFPRHSTDYLLNAFFTFCGLPLMRSTSGCCISWRADPFTRTEALHLSRQSLENFLQGPRFIDNDSLPLPRIPTTSLTSDSKSPQGFRYLFHNLVTCPDTLFSLGDFWFSAFEGCNATTRSGDLPSLEWCRRALKHLVGVGAGGSDLAEYYLAFELHTNREGCVYQSQLFNSILTVAIRVRKVSKSLLKKQPSNLRLYNAYALTERRLGNLNASNNVFSTALGMSNNFTSLEKHRSIILWKSWVWEFLQEGEHASALQRLLLIGAESVADSSIQVAPTGPNEFQCPPAALLRARKVRLHHFLKNRADA